MLTNVKIRAHSNRSVTSNIDKRTTSKISASFNLKQKKEPTQMNVPTPGKE